MAAVVNGKSPIADGDSYVGRTVRASVAAAAAVGDGTERPRYYEEKWTNSGEDPCY